MKQLKNKKEVILYHLKSPIILTSLFVLFIAIFVNIQLSSSSKETTKDEYLQDQTVENLLFKNATLVYENGISTFTVEVENTLNSEYTLNTIDIVFLDESGKTTNLLGYIGNKIKANDSQLLTASIDNDLSSSIQLKYKINK